LEYVILSNSSGKKRDDLCKRENIVVFYYLVHLKSDLIRGMAFDGMA
jgi:hypothetical protein